MPFDSSVPLPSGRNAGEQCLLLKNTRIIANCRRALFNLKLTHWSEHWQSSFFFSSKEKSQKNYSIFFIETLLCTRASSVDSILHRHNFYSLNKFNKIINLFFFFQIFRLSFLVSLSPPFSARVRATLKPFLPSQTLLTHHNSHRILFYTYIESVKLFVLPLNLYRTEPRVSEAHELWRKKKNGQPGSRGKYGWCAAEVWIKMNK